MADPGSSFKLLESPPGFPPSECVALSTGGAVRGRKRIAKVVTWSGTPRWKISKLQSLELQEGLAMYWM